MLDIDPRTDTLRVYRFGGVALLLVDRGGAMTAFWAIGEEVFSAPLREAAESRRQKGTLRPQDALLHSGLV